MVAQLRPGVAEQAAWDEAVGALLSRVAYLRHLTGAHRPAAVLHAGVVLLDLQVCHLMLWHLPSEGIPVVQKLLALLAYYRMFAGLVLAEARHLPSSRRDPASLSTTVRLLSAHMSQICRAQSCPSLAAQEESGSSSDDVSGEDLAAWSGGCLAPIAHLLPPASLCRAARIADEADAPHEPDRILRAQDFQQLPASGSAQARKRPLLIAPMACRQCYERRVVWAQHVCRNPADVISVKIPRHRRSRRC